MGREHGMKCLRILGPWFAAVVAMSAASAASASATSYSVMAWGENNQGQLGNGTDGTGTETDVPVPVRGLSGVTGVATGTWHSLAMLEDGTVMAWGGNDHGQLGDGTATGPEICTVSCSTIPVEVHGLSEVAAVSAAGYGSMALRRNGTVMTWGENEYGQLGNGTTGDSDLPVEVSGLSGVTAIANGFWHRLALLGNGTVMSWGLNEEGALGNGTNTNSDVPVPVRGLNEVVAVSAGYDDSLALLRNGTVMTWGRNQYGQLGDGTSDGPEQCSLASPNEPTPCSTLPVAVSGLSEAVAISAGYWYNLALLRNGTVMAWGVSGQGALGDGTKKGPEECSEESCSTTPVAVVEASGVREVSASVDGFTPLARLSDGTLMAWGRNVDGTLGNGTFTAAEKCESIPCTATPKPVRGLAEVADIAAGGLHELATVPAPTPPEFGRCIKVPAGMGRYENGGCSKEGIEKNYEWYAGVAKRKFTTTGGVSTIEKASGFKVVCKSESGTGEYNGPKAVAGVVLRFRECSSSAGKCKSKAAADGEVVTSSLKGALGVETLSTEAIKNEIALDLSPVEGAFAEFSCGGYPILIRGSVIGPTTANAMSLSPARNYRATSGKQKPERFEGEPRDVLEESFLEGNFERAGLTMDTTQANEERIEINSVA